MKNRWDTLLSVVRLLPFQGRNESVSIRCPVVRRKDATMNELTYRQLKELLPDTPKGKLPTAKELAECEVFLSERAADADITIYKNGYLTYSRDGFTTVYSVHRCERMQYQFGYTSWERNEGWKTADSPVEYRVVNGSPTKIQYVEEKYYADSPWWMPIVCICEERIQNNEYKRISHSDEFHIEDDGNDWNPALVVDGPENKTIENEKRAENMAMIKKAISQLTKVQQQTILVYFFEPDMTERKVARMLGVSCIAVHKTLQAALNKLRRILEMEYDFTQSNFLEVVIEN